MFIVKFYDYGICYLTSNDQPTQPFIFKASEKKAHRFPSIKVAERAYKDYYKAANGKSLKVPVKSLLDIEIIEVEEI